ncbi:MAG: ABC transporter substrate-binding protein, partial [Dehalococcoidia bacterium]|nr:ABC transporter substrate-binding protein [Dehalococcoidia bacterium]
MIRAIVKLPLAIAALLAAAALVLLALSCSSGDGEGESKETIIFSDLNWTSAQVQNRIAQYIVEHGYGYPTDVIFGGTLPNFQGLQGGDIHVAMEVWLPNQEIGWDKAVAAGDVLPI